MIEYIKGALVELTPTEAIVENNGIGYCTLISLQTYEALNGKKDIQIYIHHYLREDEEIYYGFASKDERSLFRLLIGVSGIGAATARMMLSSLSSEEIRNAIAEAIKEVNKKLPGYKKVMQFDVREEEFVKTTTHKIKRQANIKKDNKK